MGAAAGFTELLQILITADTAAASAKIDKFGKDAEKSLSKATDSTDKLGNTFVKTGAIMVGAAGIIGAGLFHAAKAADEAQQSHLKLENTVARIPELAKANIKAFDDQANALHKVTVADDDAVTAAQAMLGTFHLTQAEILKITPLVVDYARKFGVDLVEASKQVGKALEGNKGALQRNGVMLDENAYAADRFGTVMKALRENAGGYAEAEGKTFSGQLQITKNLIGDIEEGIGVGVIGAFNKVLGPIKTVSSAFSEMDANTQASIGTVLAIGTAGTGAIGGLLVLAGGILKVKNLLSDLDASAPKLANVTRGALAFGAVGGIMGTAAIAGMGLADALGQTAYGLRLNTREIEGGTKAAVDGLARKLIDLDYVTEAFDKTLESSVPAARNLADALERQGYNVDGLRKKIADKRDVDIAANKASSDYADETNNVTTALEGETRAAEDAKTAILDQTTAVENAFNSELRHERAVRDVEKALGEYATAQQEADDTHDLEKQQEAIDKYNDARDAILGAAGAAAQQAKDQFDATTALDGAAKSAGETEAANKAYRDELQRVADTLAPGSPLRVYIEQLIARMDEAAIPRTITVGMQNFEFTLGQIQALRSEIESLTSQPWYASVIVTGAGVDPNNPKTYGG